MNVGFDAYLEVGSIPETVERLNRAGYRTKAYTSRRGRGHPGREFTFSSVQYLLKNPSYIGKKEIRTAAGRQLVKAVWPAIVEIEKFEQVQALLATNSRTRHGSTKPVCHT